MIVHWNWWFNQGWTGATLPTHFGVALLLTRKTIAPNYEIFTADYGTNGQRWLTYQIYAFHIIPQHHNGTLLTSKRTHLSIRPQSHKKIHTQGSMQMVVQIYNVYMCEHSKHHKSSFQFQTNCLSFFKREYLFCLSGVQFWNISNLRTSRSPCQLKAFPFIRVIVATIPKNLVKL